MSNQEDPIVPADYDFLPEELFKEVQENSRLQDAAREAKLALENHTTALVPLAFQYALANKILHSAEWKKSSYNTIRTKDERVRKFFSCPLFQGEAIKGKSISSPEWVYLTYGDGSGGTWWGVEISFVSSDMLDKYIREWGLNCVHMDQQRLNELYDRRKELNIEIQKLEVLIRETVGEFLGHHH